MVFKRHNLKYGPAVVIYDFTFNHEEIERSDTMETIKTLTCPMDVEKSKKRNSTTVVVTFKVISFNCPLSAFIRRSSSFEVLSPEPCNNLTSPNDQCVSSPELR